MHAIHQKGTGQPDILALGEPIMEFNALDEGPLGRAGRFERGYGGDTSNFAVAAARSGARVGYIARVGTDPFGQGFLDLWEREGIDASHVRRDPLAPTGIYFNSRENGHHVFTYYRKGSAASLMAPADLPEKTIARARLLHVSGISQGISESACDTVFRAVEIAREHGVLVSYDPNLRPSLWPEHRARAVIHATMALADIVFPSLEDAQTLTGLLDPDGIVGFYRSLGAKTVVLKMGAQGALLSHGGETTPIPAHPIALRDAAGAGDTFCGAFAAELANGKDMAGCARYAAAAAALSCTGIGCVSSIPRRKAVELLLAEEVGKPKGYKG